MTLIRRIKVDTCTTGSFLPQFSHGASSIFKDRLVCSHESLVSYFCNNFTITLQKNTQAMDENCPGYSQTVISEGGAPQHVEVRQETPTVAWDLFGGRRMKGRVRRRNNIEIN